MKIIIQNIATEYRDEGSGPVMLLLHGWQDNNHTFDALVPYFFHTHRMIRIDLPGFGQSEMPPASWNLDDCVRFVAAFIDKLNLAVAVLVGHSFGGRIVIKGIADKKLHADAVVLIASAGVALRHPARTLFFAVGAMAWRMITAIPLFRFWKETIRKKLYRMIGSDYADAGALSDTFVRIIAEDVSASARMIEMSVLLIWGADDTQTPLAEGRRLSSLISQSTLRVINKAGHFVHKEHPREVARIIKEYMA